MLAFEAVRAGLLHWNGTVLTVAYGMISICMEFMHVLSQHPDCIHILIPAKLWPFLAPRHCQIYSMSHQPPINRIVMLTVLTTLWTGARSSCMPCSPARAYITCMPTAKRCPKGLLTQKHAAAKTSAPLTQYTHMLCLCFQVV
jgi:hypothetical protein